VARHYRENLLTSYVPSYNFTILGSGREILSIRNPLRNGARSFVAGLDPLEEGDRRMMQELNIPPQYLS
jgi:hypothetical protein